MRRRSYRPFVVVLQQATNKLRGVDDVHGTKSTVATRSTESTILLRLSIKANQTCLSGLSRDQPRLSQKQREASPHKQTTITQNRQHNTHAASQGSYSSSFHENGSKRRHSNYYTDRIAKASVSTKTTTQTESPTQHARSKPRTEKSYNT